MKKKSITVIRYLFGLMLLAFGIIGLLNLMPAPQYEGRIHSATFEITPSWL
ncbi:hypothetical protein [Shimazuella kribbensis]|uniref:hypothetical protein n=1 Tax=Shimazuella kribbensis TaxID=139808 RepID=UPI000413F038|nr:hypothetical protein [Shimazuella kribbensis]